MKGVFFIPWVGSKYFKYGLNGTRILVLDEAHLCSNNTDNFCEGCDFHISCTLTNDSSERFIKYKNGGGGYESWMSAWTKFINIFFGEKVTNKCAVNFWESIIFYNYVQKPILAPQKLPNKKDYNNGKSGFESVYNKYNPDIIIVWGKRLWGNMPDNGYWGKKNIVDKQGDKIYYYKGKEKDIMAYHIPKPSLSYFDYKYTKYFREIMSLI